MKFTFDEKELVEFVKHVNATIAGEYSEVESYRMSSIITQAVGDAIKVRIVSRVQDYSKS